MEALDSRTIGTPCCKVIMLVGNTGVGKSSVGCRLLGTAPFGVPGPEKPFKVAANTSAVTANVHEEAGKWFGKPELGDLCVVDTPGLGDQSGPKKDMQHVAAIGEYLNTKPVDVILFVMSSNARINVTLKQLINTVVAKLHADDYINLAIVVNQYSHSPDGRASRAKKDPNIGTNEEGHQLARIDSIISAVEGYATEDAADKLDITPEQVQGFRQRIFFVDSHYDEADQQDDDAFQRLREWCLSCANISKDAMSTETRNVYPEWQDAEDKIEALREQTKKTDEAHQQLQMDAHPYDAYVNILQELNGMQCARALEQKAEDDMQAMLQKQATALDKARQENLRLEEQLQAGTKVGADVEQLKLEMAAKMQQMQDDHAKKLDELQRQIQQDKANALAMKRLDDEMLKAQAEAADERYKRLTAEAIEQYKKDQAEGQPILVDKIAAMVGKVVQSVSKLASASKARRM